MPVSPVQNGSGKSMDHYLCSVSLTVLLVIRSIETVQDVTVFLSNLTRALPAENSYILLLFSYEK